MSVGNLEIKDHSKLNASIPKRTRRSATGFVLERTSVISRTQEFLRYR